MARPVLLASARNRHPEPFAADQPSLADAVVGLRLGDTRRLLAYWAQAHDHADGGEDNEPSSVFLSKGWKGRGRLDGDLDAEAHDLVATALDTLISKVVWATPAEDLPKMSHCAPSPHSAVPPPPRRARHPR